ncbi:MAG: hypothetical protein SVK54_02175 [candidate division WOR-3 bacterium]|nr:hypothetical protein [candidate division WOR-3 bacterium]
MKRIPLLLILLITGICLFGIFDMEWNQYNQLNIVLTNFGIIGHDVSSGQAGAYWPSGYPAENYIYGSGIWFGAIVDTAVVLPDTLRDTLVSVGYNPNSGTSEMCPGYGDETTDPLERVYNSSTDWPPFNADSSVVFDSIVSQYDTYCYYSDMDSSLHFTDENLPLGITVKQHSYQWIGPLLEDFVIIKLTVKNERSDGKSMNDCYFSYAMDSDIGYEGGTSANDINGYIDTMTVNFGGNPDTLMWLNTGYQFQTQDETGWSHTPAILSMILLESPVASDNIDLYHDGSYIISAGEEIGMTSFRTFSLSVDPADKIERYQMLAGYNHLTYDPASPENSYEPFPSWGEGTAGYPGQSENESNAGDKRFIISSGPFDLHFGEQTSITLAFAINQDSSEIVPNILFIKDFWESNSSSGIVDISHETEPEAILSDGQTKFIIRGENKVFDIVLYDIKGSRISKLFTGPVNGQKTIYLKEDIPSGIYFIVDKRKNFRIMKVNLIK